MSTTIDLTQRLRPHFREAATPIVWCHGCARERVAFNPFVQRQLCPDCTSTEGDGPVPPAAA